MGREKLIKIIRDTDENIFDAFMSNNKSSLKIFRSIEKNKFDYTWISKIEEAIEDLDTIVRNPRKFIMQEEEVVPVEKAKKISQETIKHLATHTNFIQDVDKDGNITPSNVLNINKEESFDIYENRFVKSLLDNLKTFIYLRKNTTSSGSYYKEENRVLYESKSKVKNQRVSIKLEMSTKEKEELKERSPLGLSVSERIKRIELILSDFYKSAFMKDLSNALPVRSPIRKTNVILKNPNFQKALELWEYVERYENTDIVEKEEEKELEDLEDLNDNYDLAFLLDYEILMNLKKEKKLNRQVNKYYFQKIIDDFVYNNENMTIRDFKSLLSEQYKRSKKEKKKLEKEIKDIVYDEIKEYKQNEREILKMLK